MRWEFVLFVVAYTQCLSVNSFTLDGVITGNSMAGVPLGPGLGTGELDVEGICKEPGTACQSCSSAISCIALPEGFLKVPLQQCNEGQTCNARIGRCTNEHVPECQDSTQNYQHSCEQVGIFPDAHDCRKFHLCSPPEGVPSGRPADHRTAFCPRHYGYNPQTAQCSIKLTKGQCSNKPVPECKILGQADALQLSQNYYYICLEKKEKLHPQIFLCPHGWFFSNGFCRPEVPTIIPKESKADAPQTDVKDKRNEAVATVEDITTIKIKAPKTTEGPTTTRIDSFFSTEKMTTFAPDAFLADKFDLTNYESIDENPYGYNVNNYDSASSNEFW